MMTSKEVSRRSFMKAAAGTSAGLVIGFYLPSGLRGMAFGATAAVAKEFPPNAFIKISPQNVVTLIINKSEMGQGVYTSMAQLIAEELECDWQKVKVESAPVSPTYKHTVYGMQMTGGSTSIWSSWDQYRQVGAAARQMLISAAAQQWKVDEKTCHAEKSFVIHTPSGKKISFGELADAANKLPVPEKVTLKDPKKFRLIGKPIKRLDTPAKINGTAQFGIDVQVPDMAYAVVARCPYFGGKLKSVDASKAKKIKGVKEIIELDGGVVVIASDTWSARRGREALEIKWDGGAAEKLSTDAMTKEYVKLSEKPGAVAHKAGDAAKSMSKESVEAIYQFPFLAHAPMEPLNCTIHYNGSKCEIWTGTHFQTADQMTAAEVLGLKPEQVEIHTTFLGGSFGRRANPRSDFVREAAHIAKRYKKPVKIVWTRDDDLHGGQYRPLFVHRVQASLGKDKKPLAWVHHIAGQSLISGTPFEGGMIKNGIDPTSVEGVADTPYAVPNMLVTLHSPKSPVPVQWWRSVGHTHTAFVMETMIDELATKAKKDPVEFRLGLLAKHPRHVAALKLATAKANWKKGVAKGHALGVAVHESFGSVVATVVEASMEAGQPKIHRVVCGVHCGRVVNPDGAKGQIESAVAYGLTAALYSAITIKDGLVEQNNFDTYQMLRLSEMPKVEAHFVPSEDQPTGLGEPGVPPLAPALANALFQLRGKRIRELPLSKSLA